MQKKLKTALITGAARRIGKAIASHLHTQNINLILHYHTSEKEAESFSQELNKKRSHSAVILKTNLAETPELNRLIQQAVEAFGHLDILVNNASCFYRTPWGQVTEQAWDNLMAVNVKAPLFLSQAAAPYLAKTKGCIINITDIHAEKPLRDYMVYCISKAGLIMLTQSLAKELGPNVRVNAISPGSILWPEGENTLPPAVQQTLIERTALQSHGSPEEIAKAVLFLATAADYVTGQVLTVDGGRSLFM